VYKRGTVTRRLRILMYHALGEDGEAATRFVLPVASFARQMRLLAVLRFQVVRLESAVRTLRSGDALPRRAVALTFDDGTYDTLSLALPVLASHGFPATAFVVTHKMGATIDWTDYAELAGRRIMTWEEALELEPLVRVEAHTRTHRSLPQLSSSELVGEIAGSREDVEARTGHPSDVFAYPYGHYDERVAAAVADAGFIGACSVRRGTNGPETPPYELHRYEVTGETSLLSFASLLRLRAG
jgi:peptidoglycan/xylan/chitin deacetylase (PgdA/CDA1 family)